MKVNKSVEQLVREAEAHINTLSTAEAQAKKTQPGVLMIDLRDIRELKREGRIPNTLNIPRGMLEFWIDPESPYYKSDVEDEKELVLFSNKDVGSVMTVFYIRAQVEDG